MNDKRYRMALVRMRERIANGLELRYEDSDTTGDKHTVCSWGMCSKDRAQWPDAGDHVFPVDFMDSGRISVAREVHQTCPLQTDSEERDAAFYGCFYRCRVFQPTEASPTREQALALYTQRIETIGVMPESCACDQGVVNDPVGGSKSLPCPTCRRADYEAWRPSYDPWRGPENA